MKRREFTRALGAAAAGSALAGQGSMAWALELNQADASAGLRLALERGAEAAIASLGKTDGFLGDPRVRIPLPGVLNDAAKLLKALGQGKRLDELVTAMNRAAESAVPKAKPLLLKAIKSASAADAMQIVRGGDTSVTGFFREKTSAPLTESLLPIVTEATEKQSVAQRYNALASRAAKVGLLKGDDVNIQRYVTQRTLDGLFLMIGEEEKKLRADPLKTGSALLKQVFGR